MFLRDDFYVALTLDPTCLVDGICLLIMRTGADSSSMVETLKSEIAVLGNTSSKAQCEAD